MLKTFFLLIFPLSGLVIYIFSHILFFMYHEYKNIFRVIYKILLNKYYKSTSKLILKNFLKAFFIFLTLFYIFFFKILVIFDFNLKLFYFNNLIVTQLHIYTIFFGFVLFLIYNQNLLTSKHSIDLAVFLLALYTLTFTTLCSNNIMTIFLNLEIINILIMYSFIITLHNNFFLNQAMVSKNLWVTTLCTYQFILNFFSSIVFFFIFNVLVTKVYSTNFFFLSSFSLGFNSFSMYLVGLYLAFFIKLGIGPWIFFKIELYQNFNWFLLILYTLVYFSIVLVFFLNMFVIYFLPITEMVVLFFLLFSLVIVMCFSMFVFSYFNLFVFFSFSSLINILFILLQWCFVIYSIY